MVNIRLKEGRVVIFTTPLETKTWDTGNLASASLNVDSFCMKSPHCPSTSTSTIDIATNRLVRYCYNTSSKVTKPGREPNGRDDEA